MKKLVILSLFLIMCTFFYGFGGSAPLEIVLPDTAILDKSPLNVGLYISESTRNYTEGKRLESRCGFAAKVLEPNEYGVVFCKTVYGTLKQVFKTVTPVSHPGGEGYDLIIQAEFTELGYKIGCRPDPVGYFVINGTFRALDEMGNEIWRSDVTSKKVEAPIELRYRYEKVIPSAIAEVVGSWTQALLTAPQIQKLSNSPK